MIFLNGSFCARKKFCCCKIFCEPWRKNLNSFKPCVSFAQNRWKCRFFLFWTSTENWALGQKSERRPYVFLLEMCLETFEDKFENIRGIGSIDCCVLACVDARQQFFTPLFGVLGISDNFFFESGWSRYSRCEFLWFEAFFSMCFQCKRRCFFWMEIVVLLEYSVVVEYSASLDVKTGILSSHV